MSYKFWVIDERKMYYTHQIGLIDLFGGRVRINHEWKFFDKERYGDKVNCIPLQSICKNDKNGKEIHEGDYVRYLSGNKGYYFEGTINRLNHFGYTGVFVKINTNKPYEYFMIDMMKINSEEHIYNLPEEIEIVGNIYENPELLD